MLVYRKNLDRVLTADEVDKNFSLVSQGYSFLERKCIVEPFDENTKCVFDLFSFVYEPIPDTNFRINVNFVSSPDDLLANAGYVFLSCSVDSDGVVSVSSSKVNDFIFEFDTTTSTFSASYISESYDSSHKFLGFHVMTECRFDFVISDLPISYIAKD